MKKAVVALIVVLALVIIVSPGIIGKLAEESVDENLNRAVDHSGELVISSTGFDRGWFSSEGEHRIELGQGTARDALLVLGGEAGADIPVLVINTRMDHGIIPVTSMSRDKGSLEPGLGSAVSTMRLELGDGETVDVPGTIYSKVGLGGGLESQYVLEEGATDFDGGNVEWLSTTIDLNADAGTGGYDFEGNIGGATISEEASVMTLGPVDFSGSQVPSPYGFFVGDFEANVDSVAVVGGVSSIDINEVSLSGSTRLDDDRAVGSASFSMASMTVPGLGDVSYTLRADSDLDAAAFGRLMTRLQEVSGSPDQAQLMADMEPDAKDLVAAGLEIDIPQLDIALPMGTIESVASIAIDGQDRSNFEWTSLLLKTSGNVDIRIPEALVTMATAMNPQMGGVVAAGYLQKDGEYYVLEAKLDSGVLTINGAPTVLPPGLF